MKGKITSPFERLYIGPDFLGPRWHFAGDTRSFPQWNRRLWSHCRRDLTCGSPVLTPEIWGKSGEAVADMLVSRRENKKGVGSILKQSMCGKGLVILIGHVCEYPIDQWNWFGNWWHKYIQLEIHVYLVLTIQRGTGSKKLVTFRVWAQDTVILCDLSSARWSILVWLIEKKRGQPRQPPKHEMIQSRKDSTIFQLAPSIH